MHRFAILKLAMWIGLSLCLACNSSTDRKSTPPNKDSSRTTELPPIEEERDVTVQSQMESPERMVTLALDVQVNGFANNQGRCFVAVYSGQEHFNDPDFAIAKATLEIADKRVQWDVSIELPISNSGGPNSSEGAAGSLAIMAYHDENANARLDKSSLGIPTERYGVSNNPKRGFGPPKFREAAMPISLDSLNTPTPLEIKIEVK